MKRKLVHPLRPVQRGRLFPFRRTCRPFLERLETRLAPANADVLGFHNDLFLDAQNLQEETLTLANVNPASFGKLVSQPVDGPIYAQPLYKANLMIGGTPHNVAFIATEHDSVYAFDIVDSSTAGITLSQLWQTSFINPAAGITPIPASELGNPDIVPEIGITGTPVIDAGTNTLYALGRTREVRSGVPHYVEKLHALDITNGTEKFAGPYTIGDTTQGGPDGGWTNTTSIAVPGAGDGAGPDNMVRFNAGREMQRPALQLVTNPDSSKTVYIAWASQSDFRPYHGWVIGFNAATLQPVRWFNITPNAGGGGIWESGGGLSVDPQGNIYFAEGNGFNGPNLAFDPAHGDYSESVIKLSPNGSQLTVADYFTPFNWQSLDDQDADLGSGGAMLLPDFVGSTAHPHLMVELGKEGKIYLIDRDNMGHFTPNGPDAVVQTVTAGQRGVWGNPAFFQLNNGNGMPGSGSGIIYYHGTDDVLKGYRISNGHIDDVNILRSNFTSQFPGTQPVVSANGIANPTSPTNGITWELQVDAGGLGGQPNRPAILRAFGASNLATELYDSSQTGQRDQPDLGNKFTSLAVSNGRVMTGTRSFFSIYGLFPAATAVPPARSNLAGAFQSTPQGPRIQLTWTNPAPTVGMAATGIKILRSTDGTNFTLYDTVARDATSSNDVGPFVVGQRYYYKLVATNQQGDSGASNTINVLVPIASSVLTVTGAGSASIGLSWTAVANDHYDIERSTGGAFTAIATVPAFQTSYTDPGLAAGIYAYRIHAFNVNPAGDSLSNIQGASVGPTINHSSGFANAPDLTPNGSTAINPVGEPVVRLTNADAQTGSAFSNTRTTIGRFTTTFQIRLHEGTQPNYADGLTFVIQANSPTALGQGGAGLGYQGIGHSVAVKFGTFQYAGDPSNSSVGLVINGAAPRGGIDTNPNNMGVLLNSQDQKNITLTYDGTTLGVTITDVPRQTSFSTSFTVNIPQVLGTDTAYLGFTASTGSPTTPSYFELQDIVNWTFTSQAPLPGAPSTVRIASSTSSQIDLAWDANSYNETGYRIERSIDGTNFTEIGTSSTTTFRDLGLPPATYYYRVRAYNANGTSPYSNRLQTGVAGPILTQEQDVGTPGDPAVPGSATFAAGGTYTDSGAGSDIWNQADGFHFIYKPLVGDGMITARVLSMSSIQATTFWAKAGVMIRETLAGNSRDAYVTMTPPGHQQVQFLDRDATGGNAADIGDAMNIPFPIWVRVVRQGSTFTGFYSTNGTTFNQLGPAVTITMAPAVYVGLVASAADSNGGNPNSISTSMFDNVSVIPTVLQTTHLDVSASAFAINPGAVQVTVTALDPYNNLVPGYRGAVHFTSSDPMAGLPADYTFTAADNGRHTFTVMLGTLGRQTVIATDTATNAIQGGTAVTVTNAVIPSSFLVAGFPSPAVAGTPANFTVTARDGMGHTLTGYRGSVHFNSSDTRAQLPGDYTFTANDNGVHTFMATLNTPGTQSLTATDLTLGVSGSQSGIQVVVPPSITTVSRSAAVIAQGGTLTVSGSFTDAVTGQTHQAIISWGDGSANTTLPLAAGVFTFSAGHPYIQAGSFEIHVAIMGANGGSDTVILTSSVASAAPPSGLVGWWTGDGTSSTIAPDIAGSNPGTLVNGTTHAAGEVGNAFSFNGNQWVAIATGTNIPVGNATYTLMAWIKPTVAGDEGIIGYGNYGNNNQTNALRLLNDGTGHLNFRHYWWGNDLDAFTTIPANNGVWHLAAAEFDGTTRRVILDGQVIAIDTPTGHSVPDARFFAIGVTDFNGSGGETFNGLIDEAQVYNRALTLQEIQGIYNAGSAGQIKGVQVQAVPPPMITTVSRSAAVINEGVNLTVTGAFTDPVTGQTHQAIIHWGDGSPDTTVFLAVGAANFTAGHAYTEEGNFQIQVTVMSANGGSDEVDLSVTAAAVAPPAGLVGWWTGDGTSATTAPDIAGSNPGTLVGGATHAAGEVGNAFSFNGNGQYVSLATGTNIPVGNTAYTLMAWIKPNAAGNEGIIGFGNYGNNNQVNAFRLVDNGTGHLNLLNYWWANDLEGDTNLPATGAWHLAAAEFDGTTRRILVDGQVIAMDTPTGHNVPNTANFRIGSTNNGEFFNGLIDEAQIYSRALTTTEIQAIFSAGTAGEIKGARVNDLAVIATGGFNVAAFAGLDSGMQTVATFTDPGSLEPLNNYSASINWGDNMMPSMGTISGPNANGVFTVQGSHTYAQGGNYTVTVTIHHDTASDALATSMAQVIGPITHFVVSGFPSPTLAGTGSTFTIAAMDDFGHVAVNYRGTAHFTSTDPLADLPLNYTFTASDNGQHVFGTSLETAGTQSITATDTAMSSITGTQSGIVVLPAAASSLVVSGFPSPTTAGVAQSFTVTARDRYGNTATSYRGIVHFTSGDGQAALPADYTFAAGDNGTHTLMAALKTAGIQAITATDTGNSSLTATQGGIVVNPAATSLLQVAGFPSPITVGTLGAVLVTAMDSYGNVTPAYAGTVHLTSSDPQANLEGDHTFTAADAGRHSFGVVLNTPGTQSITANDTTSAITGTQSGIVVNPGPASTFVLIASPTEVAAGDTITLTLTAYDQYGNVATGYHGTVTFSSSDLQANLPADSTLTNGSGTFTANLYTAGTQTITALDTVDGSLTSTASITVDPAAPHAFEVMGFPSPVMAGDPGLFTVRAIDAYNNTIANYAGTVHFVSSDPNAGLPGNYTFVPQDQGIHEFGAILTTPGTQSITATDSANPMISGTQSGIVVTPGRASSFVVDGFPSPTTAGSVGIFSLTAYDRYGNVASGYTGMVHFTSTDPAAELPDDYTFRASDQGTHMFAAALDTPGTQSITATDTVDGSITGTQEGIVVNPPPAGSLASLTMAHAPVQAVSSVATTRGDRGPVPAISSSLEKLDQFFAGDPSDETASSQPGALTDSVMLDGDASAIDDLVFAGIA
jgi:hypothetical protein